MNACNFTFYSLRTKLPCEVTGIERTWEFLKNEFNRNGDGLPNARYYETIGPGPHLFAVVGDTVYYNEDEKWFPYNSATNMAFGIMNIDNL